MCDGELGLDELLDDPMVRAVMDRDGVDREDLRACVERVASQSRKPGASWPLRAT